MDFARLALAKPLSSSLEDCSVSNHDTTPMPTPPKKGYDVPGANVRKPPPWRNLQNAAVAILLVIAGFLLYPVVMKNNKGNQPHCHFLLHLNETTGAVSAPDTA